MFCRDCGNEIRDDAVYCPHCGNKAGKKDVNFDIESKLPNMIADVQNKVFQVGVDRLIRLSSLFAVAIGLFIRMLSNQIIIEYVSFGEKYSIGITTVGFVLVIIMSVVYALFIGLLLFLQKKQEKKITPYSLTIFATSIVALILMMILRLPAVK